MKVQDGLTPGGTRFKSLKYIEKYSKKNLLPQNHLAWTPEIQYVALPSGPLFILFKRSSQGPRWSRTWGPRIEPSKCIQIDKKKSRFRQKHLAKAFEIWYVA